MDLSFDREHFTTCHETPVTPQVNDRLCLFYQNKLLLDSNKKLPQAGEHRDLVTSLSDLYCFGRRDDTSYLIATMPQECDEKSALSLYSLRECYHDFCLQLRGLLSYANHLHHWRELNRYCSRCAHELQDHRSERARHCIRCDNLLYPKINPCVMVLITKGDKILLAHNALTKSPFYSILAGYIEPGETAEQAAHREVLEEVGIKIKNLRYITSQPWSLSDSLLFGYTAEYESGELCIDNIEIDDANWYSANDPLPPLPRPLSLARYLVDNYWLNKGDQYETLGDPHVPIDT